MKNRNFTTIIIVIATIILAGVAIFTAIKLYQTRQGTIAPSAPTSRPAAAGVGKACGVTCNSDSECANPSANGSTVRCVEGVCQNASCIGKTIPGANCDCSGLNACGQGCSATVGLCQTGSVCRYVVGPSCTNNPDPANPTTTYCVPDPLPAGWNRINCVARDTGNSYVLNSSGANPTLAEVKSACSALVQTPAPSAAPQATPAPACSALTFQLALASPTPTPTPTRTPSPTPTPTPVPQCGTSCTTNSDCPSTMICYVGVCRNPSCTTATNCICATATPTSTPTTIAQASPTPTPIVQATPTPSPVPQCGTSCVSDATCPSGMVCSNNYCRNSACTESTTCLCATATPVPLAYASPTPAPSLPTSGAITPTILGITAGAILLILGLALIL